MARHGRNFTSRCRFALLSAAKPKALQGGLAAVTAGGPFERQRVTVVHEAVPRAEAILSGFSWSEKDRAGQGPGGW